MVRIINAFQGDSPLGTVISNLGQQLWGNGAAGEINRQNALALQRSNTETENLMRYIAENGGVQANGANPIVQAMLLGSGYAPQDFARIGLMGAATGAGARDPSTINWTVGAGLPYANTAEAFDLNLAETARNNDMASADRRYATDQTVAENARQFDMTPTEAVVNGVPVYVPRAGAFDAGVSPVLTQSEAQGVNLMTLFPSLTPAQQVAAVGAEPQLTPIVGPDGNAVYADPTTAIGAGVPADPYTLGPGETRYGANNQPVAAGVAATGTPRNYQTPDGTLGTTFDGLTDAQTGKPLPQGTVTFSGQLTATDMSGLPNSVLADQYEALNNAEDAYALGERLLESARNAPPETFGAAGSITTLLRGAVNTIANLAGLAGTDINTDTLRAWVQEQSPGLSSAMLFALFSPQANEVQALAGLYTYLAIGAITGQRNRDLSDNDIRILLPTIGDPMSWGTNQATFIAGIERAQGIIAANIERARNRIGVSGAPDVSKPVAPGAAPAPQAPQTNNLGWTTADITVENVRDTAAALNISFENALRQIAESFGIPYAEAFRILQANTPTGQ